MLSTKIEKSVDNLAHGLLLLYRKEIIALL